MNCEIYMSFAAGAATSEWKGLKKIAANILILKVVVRGDNLKVEHLYNLPMS